MSMRGGEWSVALQRLSLGTRGVPLRGSLAFGIAVPKSKRPHRKLCLRSGSC